MSTQIWWHAIYQHWIIVPLLHSYFELWEFASTFAYFPFKVPHKIFHFRPKRIERNNGIELFLFDIAFGDFVFISAFAQRHNWRCRNCFERTDNWQIKRRELERNFPPFFYVILSRKNQATNKVSGEFSLVNITNAFILPNIGISMQRMFHMAKLLLWYTILRIVFRLLPLSLSFSFSHTIYYVLWFAFDSSKLYKITVCANRYFVRWCKRHSLSFSLARKKQTSGKWNYRDRENEPESAFIVCRQSQMFLLLILHVSKLLHFKKTWLFCVISS